MYYFSSICGTLHSVDQYLNIKLTDISVTDPDKYPHMVRVKLWKVHSLFKIEMHLIHYWLLFTVVGQKLFHQRIGGQVRAVTWWWGWHTTSTRRCEERSSCSNAIVNYKSCWLLFRLNDFDTTAENNRKYYFFFQPLKPNSRHCVKLWTWIKKVNYFSHKYLFFCYWNLSSDIWVSTVLFV